MARKLLTRRSTVFELYRHPVGRDVIDKIFWTDQSTGSAISLILMIFIFVFLVLMNLFGDEEAIA